MLLAQKGFPPVSKVRKRDPGCRKSVSDSGLPESCDHSQRGHVIISQTPSERRGMYELNTDASCRFPARSHMQPVPVSVTVLCGHRRRSCVVTVGRGHILLFMPLKTPSFFYRSSRLSREKFFLYSFALHLGW